VQSAASSLILKRFDRRAPSRVAGHASLHYVCCGDPGILRVKRGKGFAYRLPSGRWLTNAGELERIRKLALPPAWRSVWICQDRHGHLQATTRNKVPATVVSLMARTGARVGNQRYQLENGAGANREALP